MLCLENTEYVKTFTPTIDIAKSKNAKDKKWYISGYASTDAVDTDGERIEPSGIDYEYFKKSGWITYEHLHGASNIIGEPIPDKIRTDNHGLYLQGILYKDSPKAQEVWNLNEALQKDSLSDRSLGFSVEGRVNSRSSSNPKIITGMTLTAVTVTTNPANLEARWKGVAKSAMTGYETNPEEMQNVGSLRTEALDGTGNSVANAITALSFVMSRYNTNDILKEAENIMRNNGYLNKNSLALLLQMSEGISRKEAIDFINMNVRGV